MGCATSKLKQSKRKAKAKASSWGVSRSYSMFVHHPPSKEGDSYHVVALTSTTLGSLSLDPSSSINPRPHYATFNGRLHTKEADEGKKMTKAGFEVDMKEAKAWSKMIDEKMPPLSISLEEPETINAWEMMEGLEDTISISSPAQAQDKDKDQDQDQDQAQDQDQDQDQEAPAQAPHQDHHHNPSSNSSLEESDVDFDTQVISAFKKAVGELSPTNPFRLSKVPQDDVVEDVKKVNGVIEMHLPFGDGTKLNVSIEKDNEARGNRDGLDEKHKLVLYFTSLRGIRKTYEDCCDVKLIFKGLGVRVDERDVSMHSAFKEELRDLLLLGGGGGGGETRRLPRVFVGDKYIGGADDIRRMDEEGSLTKLVQRCEFVEDQASTAPTTCNACGDIRFVPCETCSGSCKLYYQEEVQLHQEEDQFGFHRCPHCNENGLIRCPICCH